ncbi:uncharacterized protein LOC143025021 [Oratosquilla oratoria]|uniref:uncharacterized protein LOC143025021 n=1 Tax=Oratosquilla oratoria TaxID=337810 RepID=UPI003F7656D1
MGAIVRPGGRVRFQRSATTVLLALVLSAVSGTPRVELFTEVPSLMKERETANCLLEKVQLLGQRRANRLLCGTLCLNRPSCHGFCFKDAECHLYAATVGKTASSLVSMDLKCYSDWPRSRTLQIRGTMSSSPTVSNLAKENAVDDYYCKRLAGSCFSSEKEPKGWWLADLGESFLIGSVRVRVRDSINEFFTNVEVKVGNQAKAGDFRSYEPLAYYNGSATEGVIVTLAGESPVTGRFVSLQAFGGVALSLCEVQVLPP